MNPTHGIRAAVPCRACLSGEDLDWLGGGRSVSLALGLMTTVEVVPDAERGAAGSVPPAAEGWQREVWAFLRERLPHLAARPPAVTVRSEAPEASGLSSSTARIVALFRAYTRAAHERPLTDETLTQWAYEFEFAVFRGGGMDHRAVVEGGALLLDGRERGLPVVRDRLEFPAEWRVLVVDSGTRKDTGHHIRDVRGRLAAGDPALAAYRAEADEASGRVWEALLGRDLEALGAAMTAAHVAMRDHQRMSTPVLEELREAALRSAGLPLKLSGAGGGGALVGVCPTAEVTATVARLSRSLRVSHPAARVVPTSAAPGARREPVAGGQRKGS
ncbi:galactokinase [Streptomyces sp. CC208A]|uniref:mevalonate kinase family protein n=1 Tax=Streptomyces sp. CC208A TaxID=3044573 RepID=UPI0024A806FB|nr:galactokinase [Streptomyces sp. CC208A]